MKPTSSLETVGSFDRVYREVILKCFSSLVDGRRQNKHYGLLDALKSGFAIYSLKCASLFSFRKRSQAEHSNLQSVYGIGEIPSDNTLRNILDQVCPNALRKGFHGLFKRIRRLGILDQYRYWRKHVVVSVDGVEHFCSNKINCPYCMKRQHRDGTTSYYHSMLSAAIVCPDQKEVFVLDNEPIIKQDGTSKNDCERNAAHRLFDHLETLYQAQYFVFVFDALYACGPLIQRLAQQARWQFIIAVKPDGNRSLFRQFESRRDRGLLQTHTLEDPNGVHCFSYANNLALNQSHPDLRVNMLYYQFTDRKGKVQTFSWITQIKLTKANLYKVMKMGRSRWKIENEAFNTLKNQQYHFEHNFGHGKEHLATNFAFLMMMAFNVDQIQQRASKPFQLILKELVTKIKLWQAIQAVFKLIPCQDMRQVLLNVAQMYQIQLE
jgi:hypothetical protein